MKNYIVRGIPGFLDKDGVRRDATIQEDGRVDASRRVIQTPGMPLVTLYDESVGLLGVQSRQAAHDRQKCSCPNASFNSHDCTRYAATPLLARGTEKKPAICNRALLPSHSDGEPNPYNISDGKRLHDR